MSWNSQWIVEDSGGPALENAMTTGFWNDRILGTNREVSLRMALTWLGTSNNATMTNDMVGRTCHIRLETKLENPSQRSGFRHDDLLAYAKANRKKLAIAVLSIPARFIETGRPNQNLPTWGGFQGWSGLVRESIVWAGLTDPGLARSKLAEQADDEKEEFRELIDAWKVFKLPTTVSEALKIIEDESDVQYDGLRGIVQAFPKNPNRALGNLLKAARERVVDGRKICRNDKDPPRWFVTAA